MNNSLSSSAQKGAITLLPYLKSSYFSDISNEKIAQYLRFIE
jgi:hypothetical protein